MECYNDGKKINYTFFKLCNIYNFFPHLIADPIKTKRTPQILKNSPISFYNLNLGLVIFFIGLFKKVILADTFASYSDDPFNSVENGYDISFLEAWLAMISFSLQIYFDFSGYTDMAVGLAKIFNISFPINFYFINLNLLLNFGKDGT